MSSETDNYVKLRLVVVRCTANAALVIPEWQPDGASLLPQWVPLSLFGKLSDRKVEAAAPREVVAAYLFEWKLRQLGWLP